MRRNLDAPPALDGTDGSHPVSPERIRIPSSLEEYLEDEKPLPPATKGDWLGDLQQHFGVPLLMTLSISQHTSKGFTQAFLNPGQRFIFRQYHASAVEIAVYEGLIRLPWVLKPLIGVVSDTCPILGYSKGPYLALSSVMVAGALAALAVYQRTLAVLTVVLLLFCVTLHCSTVDLLTEAAYARELRRKPAQGPSLVVFVWGGTVLFSALGYTAGGLVLDGSSPWRLYHLAIVPACGVLVPAALNWLGERRLDAADVEAQRARVLGRDPEVLVLALAVVLAAAVLLSAGLWLESKRLLAAVSLSVLGAVVALFCLLLSPMIAKVVAFVVIQNALAVNWGSGAFYYMLDDAEAFPEGPHFSVLFYSVVLPVAGCCFTLVGIGFYAKFMQGWSHRYIFTLGNLVYFFACCLDVVFYRQWHRRYGVDDHVFCLGTAAFESLIEAWLYVPTIILLSQMCPQNLEAIMYSLLAGCANIGNVCSRNFGAFLLDEFGVHPTGRPGEGATFHNLWKVTLLASTLPLLVCALIPVLIPDAQQTRSLTSPDRPATHGSVWRQWHGEESADLEAQPLAGPRTDQQARTDCRIDQRAWTAARRERAARRAQAASAPDMPVFEGRAGAASDSEEAERVD